MTKLNGSIHFCFSSPLIGVLNNAQIGVVFSGIAGVSINLILLVLNLLPIPPLDGSRVVSAFLPKKLAWQYNRIESFGFIILVGLMIMGMLSPLLIGPYTFFKTAIFALVGI